MKKLMMTMVLCVGLIVVSTQKSHAILWTVIKAAIVKAIKAADLAIQKQQNKVIMLQNAQKKIENAMAKTKLNEIGDWVKKQKELYKKYYEELRKVKAVIAYYQRIKDMIALQLQLVDEYKKAWQLFRQDDNFTADELEYIGKVYSGILSEGVKNIDQLYIVINSFQTQMSDAKRMEMIQVAADKMEEQYSDLRMFNQQNIKLSLQRSKGKHEVETVRKLYGLQ